MPAAAGGSSSRCFLLVHDPATEQRNDEQQELQQQHTCPHTPHVGRTQAGATRAAEAPRAAAAADAAAAREGQDLLGGLMSAQQRAALATLLHTVPVYAVVDSEQQRLLPASFPSVAAPGAAPAAAAETAATDAAVTEGAAAAAAAAAAEERPVTVRQLRRVVASELQQLLRTSSCPGAAASGVGIFFLDPHDAQQYLLHLEQTLPRTSSHKRSRRLQIACFSLGSVYPLLAHPLPAGERRRLRAAAAAAAPAGLSFKRLVSRARKFLFRLNGLHLLSPLLSLGFRKSAAPAPARRTAVGDAAARAAMRRGEGGGGGGAKAGKNEAADEEEGRNGSEEVTGEEATATDQAAAATAARFLEADEDSTRYVLLPDVAELEGVLQESAAAAFVGTPLFYVASSRAAESPSFSPYRSSSTSNNVRTGRSRPSAAASAFAFPASLNPLGAAEEPEGDVAAETVGRNEKGGRRLTNAVGGAATDADTAAATATRGEARAGNGGEAATGERRKTAATPAAGAADVAALGRVEKEQLVKFFFFSSADALRALRAARARRHAQQQQALLQQQRVYPSLFSRWWGGGSGISRTQSRSSSEELQLRVTSLETLLEELADIATAAKKLQQERHLRLQQQQQSDLLSSFVLVPSRESYFCCQRLMQARAQQDQEQQSREGLLSSVGRFIMRTLLRVKQKQPQRQAETTQEEEDLDASQTPEGTLAPGDIIPENA